MPIVQWEDHCSKKCPRGYIQQVIEISYQGPRDGSVTLAKKLEMFF